MFHIFSHYGSAKSFLLMIVEGFLVVLSLLCAAKLRFWNNPADFAQYVAYPDFAVQSIIVVVVCVTCFYYNDLYDLSTGYGSMERVLRIEQSLGAASLLLGLLYFMFPGLLLSRGVFIIAMILVTAFVVLSRRVFDKVWQLTAPIQRVIILGTGEMALEMARELTRREDLSLKLEGFVSGAARGPEEANKIFGFPVLGSAAEMEAIAKERAISRIIVALEDRRGTLPSRELVTLRVRGVRVDDASSALSVLTGRVALRSVKPSWFVFSDGFHRSKWNDLAKRVLDLVGGVIGLVISLPIMILVAVAVRLDSKGPVIYRQTRVGRMGKCFEVLKFRSMKTDAEQENGAQWAIENDPRVTRVGGFLRKYRLDELPQFLNVIRGEMSFVGPRPERPCFVEELSKTIPYYEERHSVRPGLTGWAQVQYAYGSSVEDAFNKLEYDLFYLKNLSLTFDLGIIFKTIRIVINGHGGR
jgi:sugar transferase (PEP-CTERM system associated)